MDQKFKDDNGNTKKYLRYTMRFCIIVFCGKSLSKYDIKSKHKEKDPHICSQ